MGFDKLQGWFTMDSRSWQSEPRLMDMDRLVRQYQGEKDPYKKLLIASSLFFMLDHFLKGPRPSKLPFFGPTWSWSSVESLYKTTAESLSECFGCSVNVLPSELELMFGKELTAAGVNTDLVLKLARYMPRAEAAKYRLIFKDGLAYQWAGLPELGSHRKGLVKAESRPFAAQGIHPARPEEATLFSEFAFFVMSMDSEIYMAKHKLGEGGKQDGIYHSSYLAGGAVKCAGSLRIVQGVITGVRNDSGHYKPGDNNMLAFLQALRDIHRVKEKEFNAIQVYDYDQNLEGYYRGTAPEFMTGNQYVRQTAINQKRKC